MLSLKPIPEDKANAQTADIYRSVKQVLGSPAVPVIFQYLANFPSYLNCLWQQAIKNLTDLQFQQHCQAVSDFANNAICQIYLPSSATGLFLEKIEGRGEKFELSQFVAKAGKINASLYLLSLAVRESIKGRYLGIKQIGEKLEEKERVIFSDLKDGFFTDSENTSLPFASPANSQITSQTRGLTLSVFAEFFKLMEWEMETLGKKEEYLTRRVELERFTLLHLPLLPHPLDSSFTTVARQTAQDVNFPELLYLVSELFPTQAPYKVLASAVMKKALFYKMETADTKSHSPILLPGGK